MSNMQTPYNGASSDVNTKFKGCDHIVTTFKTINCKKRARLQEPEKLENYFLNGVQAVKCPCITQQEKKEPVPVKGCGLCGATGVISIYKFGDFWDWVADGDNFKDPIKKEDKIAFCSIIDQAYFTDSYYAISDSELHSMFISKCRSFIDRGMRHTIHLDRSQWFRAKEIALEAKVKGWV